MTESSDILSEVLTSLLERISSGNQELYTALRKSPLLQEAWSLASRGQVEEFYFHLPYRLGQLVDGLLQSALPEKQEAHFILTQYGFLSSHIKGIVKQAEGLACCADKSRTILHRLLQYYLTGKEVVFDPNEKYTFGHPTAVLKTHAEIVEFFEALRSLYYGIPGPYLKVIPKYSNAPV